MSVGGGGYVLSNYVWALSSRAQRESYKLEQKHSYKENRIKIRHLEKNLIWKQNGSPHVPAILRMIGKDEISNHAYTV